MVSGAAGPAVQGCCRRGEKVGEVVAGCSILVRPQPDLPPHISLPFLSASGGAENHYLAVFFCPC